MKRRRRRSTYFSRRDRIKMVLAAFERLHGCEPRKAGCCVVSIWMSFLGRGVRFKKMA